MASVDVTVRGAGVFGLSVAYACLKRGATVQVIDPNGVASGASGGVVGALSPHTPENWNPKKAFQFESLIQSRTFWPEVEAEAGVPSGYRQSGRLQPIDDDAGLDLALARARTAADLWQGLARWEVVEASNTDPWLPRSAAGRLIHDTLSAQIDPRQATHALAKAVQAKGGRIAGEGTDGGQTVWATGAAGLQEISQNRPRPMGQAVKGQAAVLQCATARQGPQIFGGNLHILDHGAGRVAVGSTTENTFEHQDVDRLLDDVVSRARALLPALKDAPIIERWAGLRPRARSRAPMLGAYPGRDGHFIANGGFKIGFGMAPKVGEVMADLILEGRTTYPPEFDLTASF